MTEKIVRKRRLYFPGIIFLSIAPLIAFFVGEGQGIYPMLWSLTFALGPGVFALAFILIIRIWQGKSTDVRDFYKIPLIIFYVTFLLIGYQTVRTIDQQKQKQFHHDDNNE